MLAREIIDDVLTLFGDRSGAQVNTEDCIRWINDAQLEIVRQTECNLQIEYYTTIPGTNVYATPDDFLKFNRVVYDGIPLLHTTQRDMDMQNEGRENSSASGTPTRFYRSRLAIVLWPSPSEIKGFTIEYLARPELIRSPDQSLTIPEEYQKDIKSLLLARAYETDDNMDAAQAKEKKFEDRIVQNRDDEKNPHMDSYPAIRDVSDYGGDYW